MQFTSFTESRFFRYRSTPFLDLNLCVPNGTVSTKMYDTRGDFDFDSEVPFSGWRCSPAYLIWGIHISTY